MKKQIVAFGDSNTYGFSLTYDGSGEVEASRFPEHLRWTTLLNGLLGDEFEVINQGKNGRTTVFQDPFESDLCGIDAITPCLQKIPQVELLIVMLGTNDTKSYFSTSSEKIAKGIQSLIQRAKKETTCKILIISPPPMTKKVCTGLFSGTMGEGAWEKSSELAKLYEKVAEEEKCFFFDGSSLGNVFNEIDYMHLTEEGHKRFSDGIFPLVKNILS